MVGRPFTGGPRWPLACPVCHVALELEGEDLLACSRCDRTFPRTDQVWRMLLDGRAEAYAEFVARYEKVRRAEGRAAPEPRRLRALPFRAPSRAHAYEWRIRARSFRALLERVIAPGERAARRPLRIVDLGSGLGWLAYRLAARGHDVVAIDILVNDFDGLGVHRSYDRPLVSVQAEFDRLPLRDGDADVLVYNASFHYAAEYEKTLAEGLRVLGPGGSVVVLDSPLYRDASSGEQMVREREEGFERQHGLRPHRVKTEGFVTYDRLATLGERLGVRWQVVEPWYGFRWWIKPWIARLRGTREPARFKLIVGRRPVG
jgi:SAM-dependent methyltransferase